MPTLPLILAGPILRRVEPTSVSVWVALSKNAPVELHILNGNPPNAVVAENTTWQQPRRLGANLYVIMVTVDLVTPLDRNQVYAYDLSVNDPTGAIESLGSLGFLNDVNDPIKPHLPIGYAPGLLPTFVLPAGDIKDLNILHGSCRKPHGPGLDALAYADALIGGNHNDPLKRPQQLFLTGDQIYADDVAEPLLYAISDLADRLFGPAQEQLPIGPSAVTATYHEATLANFPAGRRQDLVTDRGRRHQSQARLSSDEAASHLLSFREFCAMYILVWSDEVWPADLKPSSTLLASSPLDSVLTPLPGKESEKEDRIKAYDAALNALADFRLTLPSVRRVLANIPTYMILDDHEITDDWYLLQTWRDRVLAAPLGRAIIRNGLAAYAMFQGWGNDPDYFRTPAVGLPPLGVALLNSIETFATDTSQSTSLLETLLGMDLPPNSSAVRWNYTVTGEIHHVIVLDTRTHRSYSSKKAPPALIDPLGMPAQIQSAGKPVTVNIVVSAAPVLGVALMESFQKAAIGWENIKSFDLSGQTGRLEMDAEPWAYDTWAFEKLLENLLPLLPHVVLLSGDAHYSFSTFLTYWKQQSLQGRIIQLTASSLKNHSDKLYGFFNSLAGDMLFGDHLTATARLGWNSAPLSIGPFVIPDFFRARLEDKPPNLPTLEHLAAKNLLPKWVFKWPIIAQFNKPADWSWRWHLAFDTREDDDTSIFPRPVSVRPQPLADDDGVFMDGYSATLARQLWQVATGTPRTLFWPTSIGEITFDHDSVGNLAVRHALVSLVDSKKKTLETLQEPFDITGSGPPTLPAALIVPVAHTIDIEGFAENEPTIP